MPHFHGFSRDFPRFLFELPFENTLEKQEENVAAYRELLLEPLKSLYLDLQPLIESFGVLETLPRRCVCTPYTDRRFCPTEPLKNYVYLKFRQAGRETDRVGLYFDMGCDGYACGLRFYQKTTAGMRARRDDVAARPDAYRKALLAIGDKPYLFHGEAYKRDHCPDCNDPLIKNLLNRKYFSVDFLSPINETVFSSALADELADNFQRLSALLQLVCEEEISFSHSDE